MWKYINNFNSFNENNSDWYLEILITLEEIQTKLRAALNSIKLDSNDSKDDIIFYEYHSGAPFKKDVGPSFFKKWDHYEKVKIYKLDDVLVLEWLIVLDNDHPHYTPENLNFNTSTEVINFLNNRYLKNAWKIANLGNNLEAFIVVFTPKKDSVLASLVIGNKQFKYRDYPAKYDGGSTWRVDDGGEFPNDAIRILAIFRNQQGEIEIITEWAGAEGANIEYFKFKNKKIEVLKESSRYWGAG